MIQERLMDNSNKQENIEISQENNCLIMYNESNENIIEIDDDSAVDEGFLESPIEGFPDANGNYDWVSKRFFNGEWLYKYPAKGPGIRVGLNINDAGGFSAVGRKKIITTGGIEATSPDGLQKTRITKTGIHTTGDAYVVGKIETEGTSYVGGNATFGSELKTYGPIKVGALQQAGITTSVLTVNGKTMNFVNGILVSVSG